MNVLSFWRHWIARKTLRPTQTRPRLETLEDRTLLANAIVAENALAGTPQSTWDISGSGSNIEGFTDQISYNLGQTVNFKINTSSKHYRLDVYRMGYYQGNGARLITSIDKTLTTAQSQPAPIVDPVTNLQDYGNWGVSASWTIPTNLVSGIYFAKLVREDSTSGSNHVFFVIRNDASTSDLLFQTSDTTWEAYNSYGGLSLYDGNPGTRAFAVSYNRPFVDRGTAGGFGTYNWVFHAEYPMVRWLEANGYDVTYFTHVDSAARGTLIKNHKAFLSVGHDEYWANDEFNAVVAARDAGVNLAFFSGNEIFWKTRWTNSIDGSNTPFRTLVCYKETFFNSPTDPQDPSTWTGTWMDPRFSPPADGGRPQNALSGQLWTVNRGPTDLGTAIQVPGTFAKLRFWRNTAVASLTSSQTLTLAPNTLGYEADSDIDNGFRPAGLFDLSATTFSGSSIRQDYGVNFAAATVTHNLTLYRAKSGALVFGAGTVQWSWGLDGNHDDGSSTPDVNVQQATVNLLADMNAQPGSLQPGLIAALTSTDKTAPVSTVISATGGTTVNTNVPSTISGTASDSGGVVAVVEVSVDGGVTWHRANGTSSWTYTWMPNTNGTVIIKSRAVDDSGNLETPSAGISVTAVGPLSLLDNQTQPDIPNDPDASAVELGVKFRADVTGTISGIRFYKGTNNTGTHVGSLWSNTGTLLASATFTSESASGWQTVTFSTPVSISANTTYVASYHTNVGHYSDTANFWRTTTSNGPLHGLAGGLDGPNGVYAYSVSSTFPNQATNNPINYWVDLLFNPTGTLVPTVINQTPAPGATNVAPTTTVQATFNESVIASTISFTLKNASGTTVASSVSYNDATHVATLTPSTSLAGLTTYTATVSGATDANGKVMTPVSWSFTTAAVVSTTPIAAYAFNEGSGTTVTDLSGNGHTGTIANATWTTAGKYGNALSFNGTNAWVTINDANDLDLTTGMTLEAWVRPTATPSFWAAAIAKEQPNDPANNVAYALYTADGASNPPSIHGLFGSGAGADKFAVGTSVLTLNTWTHLAGTYDGTALRLYVNGTLVATFAQTGSMTATTGPLRIGGDFGNEFFTGLIDEVRVYNRALSQTEIQTDMTTPLANGPAVTSQSPAPGATNVATTTTVQAVFNKAVVASTISFTVKDAANNPVAGSVSYNGTTNTATFTPSALLSTSTTYTATVSGAQDSSGNTMSPVSWSFTTEAAPALTSQSPAPGATNVATTTTVQAVFNKAIQSSTLSFVLKDASGATVASTVAYNASTNTATLTPNAALANSATYTATVSGAKDSSGNTMTPVSWSFTTAAGTVPAVTSTTPAAGATNVATNTTVQAMFNKAVVASTISFSLKDAANNPVSGSVAYNATTNTATFTPSALLATATTFTATVSGAKDSSGNTMAPVSWSFTTEAAPALTSKTPASGATNVATTSTVQAVFNKAIQSSTLSFVLKDASGATVASTVAYNASTNTATLTPNALLATATTFTATVSGAKDASGNLMAPVSWSFTTEAAPAVTSTLPAAGATNVSLNTTVQAVFNKPVVASSISFVLKGPSGATVTSTMTYNATTNTATLTPGAPLASSTTYTATVSGVKDASGNVLAAPVSWSFTTGNNVWTQSTAADFNAGTQNSTLVTDAPSVGVQLAPAFQDNFTGTSLSSSWSTQSYAGQGGGPLSLSVSGGLVSVQGGAIASTTTYNSNTAVEGRIQFGAAAAQDFGLATAFNVTAGNSWVAFSTKGTTTTLYARVNRNGTLSDISLGALPTGFHVYTIRPTGSSFQFYVDGVLQTTIKANIPASTKMQLTLSSFNGAPTPAIQAEWLRVATYPSSGTFTSSVFDAGQAVTWGLANWTSKLPTNTTLTVQTRSGNTATPDGSWSAWSSVSNGGTIASPAGRYLQYQVTLTTTDATVTPTLFSITFNYA
jgi:hypothetical protein